MDTAQPTPALRLSRAQRDKLKAGECPGITGEGQCPVERDDVVSVVKHLEIRVLRVDPKPGGWKLHYEVRDQRDPVRLVRRTPPVVPPRTDDRPDVEAIKQAGRESAYTSSPRSAISDAGEAVDEKTQAQFTENARDRFKADLEAERERRKRLPVSEQLAEALEKAKDRRADVSSDLRVIQKRIDAMQRKTDAA